MKLIRPSPQTIRHQAGYALLMVIFLATVLLIALSVATPNLITQGKREKEEELIWRGQQYARGVGFYYRKFGRFPQALEDLTQAKGLGQIRFMRKAYKDPMNTEDGTWRLIYVSPSGQLIGSVRQRSLLEGLEERPTKRRPTRRQGTFGDDTSDQDQPALPRASTGSTISANPTPSGDDLTGKVFGGNIIGVGSKVDKPSIRAYEGATVYREWEFLFDPSKNVAGAAARPATPAPPIPPLK